MARTDDGEIFNCDACSRETPLWDGDNLNGYHDAGVHLCPECDNRLPVGTQVDHRPIKPCNCPGGYTEHKMFCKKGLRRS